MSTHDVPGANPQNIDILKMGCWAEHSDGSLLFVKSTEHNQVVYELYDLQQSPPIYYQDAMRENDFKQSFSYPPIGNSDIEWTWHDKQLFPWVRVMRNFNRPIPQYSNVEDQLSAAAKVAESLKLRGRKLSESDVGHKVEQKESGAVGVVDRIKKALDAFIEG